jgi:hypothetical protein
VEGIDDVLLIYIQHLNKVMKIYAIYHLHIQLFRLQTLIIWSVHNFQMFCMLFILIEEETGFFNCAFHCFHRTYKNSIFACVTSVGSWTCALNNCSHFADSYNLSAGSKIGADEAI